MGSHGPLRSPWKSRTITLQGPHVHPTAFLVESLGHSAPFPPILSPNPRALDASPAGRPWLPDLRKAEALLRDHRGRDFTRGRNGRAESSMALGWWGSYGEGQGPQLPQRTLHRTAIGERGHTGLWSQHTGSLKLEGHKFDPSLDNLAAL